MILTTPTKQPFTTTKHNNKSYIFTLYLFMLLCVVCNCLLFYCSCTGNCENCCGINGSASVSGGSKDKSESENDEYENESMIEFGNKDIIENNKNNSEINDIKNNSEIWNKNQQNKMDKNDKLKDFTISADGKIDGIQIVNKEFAKGKLWDVLIKKLEYKEDAYKELENKFMKDIDKKCGTHLSAYVEVENDNEIKLRCFVWCKDANSIYDNYGSYYGLFRESKATKIVILSCGNNIDDMRRMFYWCSSLTNINFPDNLNTNTVKDMRGMFYNCSSLKELNLSSFNTNNVTDMSCMFWNCSSLTNLNLSNFNTTNVTDMQYMFCNCSSLTELDLSNFNTENVTNMSYMFCNCSNLTELDLSNFNTDKVEDVIYMFYHCFKNEATLICTASTIQKITENENSCLIIPNKINNEIKALITNKDNKGNVYTCTVERVWINTEITKIA